MNTKRVKITTPDSTIVQALCNDHISEWERPGYRVDQISDHEYPYRGRKSGDICEVCCVDPRGSIIRIMQGLVDHGDMPPGDMEDIITLLTLLKPPGA